MPALLEIKTSIFSDGGQSSLLANEFVEKWKAKNPNGVVRVRDLAQSPVPHLTAERFQAFTTDAEDRTPDQQKHVAVSDELIEELKDSDITVIGLPMYNFGIPSTLKAWIDHVARARVTFKYSESGPVGLLPDRKTIVFAARGGQYKGTLMDTQSAYITNILNFMGIKDIEFVFAEGLASGDETRQSILASASKRIEELVD